MSVELVAEIGSNWNGDSAVALAMIREAKAAGTDTVKFQHYPDERYGLHPLDDVTLDWFSCYAAEMKIGFLCSVFDQRTLREYIEFCQPTPVRVKIASPELTDHNLLRACADAGLHIILSTGMSTEEQIAESVAIIEDRGARVTLLHCVSSYPAPAEEMNLRAMRRLSRYGPVGLSDHSLNPIVAPVAATALGAVMIEKHFTLDREQDGPDHSYALNPYEFTVMTGAVRMTELMLGDGRKRVMPSEDPTDRRTAEWRAA